MKSRDVVGKRITKVNQHQFWNKRTGRRDNCVDSLELEDGTVIAPVTIEGEAEYGHEFAVWKTVRKRT